MAKGSKITVVRLGEDVDAAIAESIASINARPGQREPMDLSGWVRIACRERLAKLARGRRGKADVGAPQVAAE